MAAVLAVGLVLTGCGGGADGPPAVYTNRLHAEGAARPDYWVRAPYDRFALEVEESAGPDGGKRWRGVVRAYTPSKRGEGTLNDVLWRDDTLYDSRKDQPEYRWQEGGTQVWIFTNRRRAAVTAEDEVRVVEAGADGVWRSRTVAVAEYSGVPADVRAALPFWLRERPEGRTGTNP
ncbi:hypothetical protein ACFU7Y_36300 [Kitasatospora sp. NPDC057542]|uniref:hypothetical protein n=1 Tax=Streptomycetaceae TaxID=2062 RepID=UPI001CCDCE6A|nr:hypothetical protein [Streptomyces sp. LS1784]